MGMTINNAGMTLRVRPGDTVTIWHPDAGDPRQVKVIEVAKTGLFVSDAGDGEAETYGVLWSALILTGDETPPPR